VEALEAVATPASTTQQSKSSSPPAPVIDRYYGYGDKIAKKVVEALESMAPSTSTARSVVDRYHGYDDNMAKSVVEALESVDLETMTIAERDESQMGEFSDDEAKKDRIFDPTTLWTFHSNEF